MEARPLRRAFLPCAGCCPAVPQGGSSWKCRRNWPVLWPGWKRCTPASCRPNRRPWPSWAICPPIRPACRKSPPAGLAGRRSRGLSRRAARTAPGPGRAPSAPFFGQRPQRAAHRLHLLYVRPALSRRPQARPARRPAGLHPAPARRGRALHPAPAGLADDFFRGQEGLGLAHKALSPSHPSPSAFGPEGHDPGGAPAFP